MRIKVQQKATIWYQTTVEAENREEALHKARFDEGDLDWDIVPDSNDFQDEYWTDQDE